MFGLVVLGDFVFGTSATTTSGRHNNQGQRSRRIGFMGDLYQKPTLTRRAGCYTFFVCAPACILVDSEYQ